MHRIDGPGATVDNKFTDGDPVGGVQATMVTDDWANDVQEELISVLAAAAITPVKGTQNQVLTAIQRIASSSAAIAGNSSNLKLSTTGTNATVTLTADSIAIKSSTDAKVLDALSLAINSATVGANGLDTGTIAASSWYSVWVIYNPLTNTRAGLISLSSTAPTMPADYTYKARVGWIRTDATANKFPFGVTQTGRTAAYKVGGNLATNPVLSSGAVGSFGASFATVSISALVPPTACRVFIIMNNTSTTNGAGVIAPNANYAVGYGNANSPPIAQGNTATISTVSGMICLESTNLYLAMQVNTSSVIYGWEDNL